MQTQTRLAITSLQEKAKLITNSIDENLTDSQKKILTRIFGMITYKWRWQIALNSPFVIWWALDSCSASIHTFDTNLIASLPIPDWFKPILGIN